MNAVEWIARTVGRFKLRPTPPPLVSRIARNRRKPGQPRPSDELLAMRPDLPEELLRKIRNRQGELVFENRVRSCIDNDEPIVRLFNS